MAARWARASAIDSKNDQFARVLEALALRDDLRVAHERELHRKLAAGLHGLEEQLDDRHVEALDLVHIDDARDRPALTASASLGLRWLVTSLMTIGVQFSGNRIVKNSLSS